MNMPVGEVLVDKFIVGKCLGEHFHYDSYEIRRIQDEEPHIQPGLEARVFDLARLSGSNFTFVKYRKAKIKRLSRRTILKTEWNGLDVVVFTTGKLPNPPGPDAFDNSSATRCGNDNGKADVRAPEETVKVCEDDERAWCGPRQKCKPKSWGTKPTQAILTHYQREARRLKQQDRRRAARQLRRSAVGGSVLSGKASRGEFVPGSIGLDESLYTTLQLLYVCFVKSRAVFPSSRGVVLVQHHFSSYWKSRHHVPLMREISDMEDYIQLKESEIVFLRRGLHKLPAAMDKINAELVTMFGQKIMSNNEPFEIVQVRDRWIVLLKLQLKILENGWEILPHIIKSTLQQKRSVQKDLAAEEEESRRKKLTRKLRGLRNEKKELKRKGENYQNWRSSFVPTSVSSARLEEQAQSTHKKMEIMAKEIEELKLKVKACRIS